ncbi:MAG: CHAP domain-containing protein [Ruminococcus sp.]|nr:CHAP domain-containing protein [Ruminococcus sp.]
MKYDLNSLNGLNSARGAFEDNNSDYEDENTGYDNIPRSDNSSNKDNDSSNPLKHKNSNSDDKSKGNKENDSKSNNKDSKEDNQKNNSKDNLKDNSKSNKKNNSNNKLQGKEQDLSKEKSQNDKGLKQGTKSGGKSAEKAAEQSAGQGAKASMQAQTAGTQVAARGTSKAVIVGGGGCLSTFVPLICIIMAAVFVLNSILLVLLGTQELPTTDLLSSEAEQIMYIFDSFAVTSNDSEKSEYHNKLEQIKSKGSSSGLCAVWKVLVDDFYYQNVAEQAYQAYDKDSFSSAYDQAYNDFVACYYLGKSGKAFKYATFKDHDKKADNYIDDQQHYHYCNNTLKMCIDTFVNPETNNIYSFSKKDYKQYCKDNKEKLKDLSEEEKIEKYNRQNFKTMIKNLEGEKGGLNTCCVIEQVKDREKAKSGASAKKIKEKKIKTEKFYLSQYIYTQKDDGTKVRKFNDKGTYKLSKSVYEAIFNYKNNYEVGNGNATEICTLAYNEIGKKGEDYCKGQTKAWGNGGITQWCAIFQAYLLEQVGVEPSKVGWAASCSSWIKSAKSKGIYRTRDSYNPKAGDILFFSWVHVGLVYDVHGPSLITIEGNTDSNNCNTSVVGKHDKYTTKSTAIIGYLAMGAFYPKTAGQAQGTGINVVETDPKYNGGKVKLTKGERSKIEHLVYNENGVNGYTGCLLVAQCLRDAILTQGYKADTIKKDLKYEASDTAGTPSEDAKKAVKFIFDQGGYVVKHRILYFYNPKLCKSKWHETQVFICQYGTGKNIERYFDKKE